MDAAAGGDCDIRVGVDGMLLNMVTPSTKQMQPLQLRCILQRLGQPVERDQDRLVCESLCGRECVSAHIGSLEKKIGKTISGMQGERIQQTPTITPVRGCLRCSHTRQRACSICTTSYSSPREDDKKKKGAAAGTPTRACKRNPNISVWLLGNRKENSGKEEKASMEVYSFAGSQPDLQRRGAPTVGATSQRNMLGQP